MSYNRTLWVGNLADGVDEDILIELFCHAGPIESVSRKATKQGQLPSYAFVTFVHDESVHYAMALMEGTELFGRPLAIKLRHGCEPNTKYQAMLQEYFLNNSRGNNGRQRRNGNGNSNMSGNRRHSDEGLVRQHSQNSFDRGYGGSPNPQRQNFQNFQQMDMNMPYDVMCQDLLMQQQQLLLEQQIMMEQQSMGGGNMLAGMSPMSSSFNNGGPSYNRRSFDEGDFGERDRKRHRGDSRDRSRGRYSDEGHWDSRRRQY